MTGTTFAAYIRKLTKTNSTTFPDADIVTFANIVKDDLAAAIAAEVDENYFDIEITRDLESGERGYTFDDNLLKHVKYVAVKLDGTNWTYLEEEDISHFDTPLLENRYIKEKYSGKAPVYYISGRSLRLLTGDDIDDVSGGLKVLGEIYPEDIDTNTLSGSDDLSIPSSDTAHALPRQVQKHWAIKVAIEYKQSRDKPIPLTQQEQRVDIDLSDIFAKLDRRNAVRSFIASTPYNEGQDY